MSTDRSAHQPIEKQVEEALPCNCMAAAFGHTKHADACWSLRVPAVLALLERRESEHAAELEIKRKSFEAIAASEFDLRRRVVELERREQEHAAALKFCRDMALSAQKKAREYHERREQEHATLLKALIHLTNETLASTGMAEHELREVLGNTNFNCLVQRAAEAKALIAKVEGTAAELGPCGRHGKEFWVPCSMCEEIGPPNGRTGWPFKPNEGEPGHHDYNSEGGFVQFVKDWALKNLCTPTSHEIWLAAISEAGALIAGAVEVAAEHRFSLGDVTVGCSYGWYVDSASTSRDSVELYKKHLFSVLTPDAARLALEERLRAERLKISQACIDVAVSCRAEDVAQRLRAIVDDDRGWLAKRDAKLTEKMECGHPRACLVAVNDASALGQKECSWCMREFKLKSKFKGEFAEREAKLIADTRLEESKFWWNVHRSLSHEGVSNCSMCEHHTSNIATHRAAVPGGASRDDS